MLIHFFSYSINHAMEILLLEKSSHQYEIVSLQSSLSHSCLKKRLQRLLMYLHQHNPLAISCKNSQIIRNDS